MDLISSDDVNDKCCKVSSLTIRPDRYLTVAGATLETQFLVYANIKVSILISPAFHGVTPSLEKLQD